MNRFSIALLAAIGVSSSAAAADLIIAEPAGIVEAPAGTWDGVFIGGFVGYGSGTATDTYPGDEIYDHDLSGWLAGAALGVNFTVADGVVAGIVGDIAWSDVGASEDVIIGSGVYNYDINWSGSLRGRLGFDGGAFLPYLTAGLAVADATSEYVLNDVVQTTDSETHIGWTVGAGVEFAVTEDLSLDLLYRYSDYGDVTYNRGGPDYDVEFTTHQVSAGLNFKF